MKKAWCRATGFIKEFFLSLFLVYASVSLCFWRWGKQKCKGHHESQQDHGQSYAQERQNKFWRQARQTSFLRDRSTVSGRGHYNYSFNKREFSRGKPAKSLKEGLGEQSVSVSYAVNLTLLRIGVKLPRILGSSSVLKVIISNSRGNLVNLCCLQWPRQATSCLYLLFASKLL